MATHGPTPLYCSTFACVEEFISKRIEKHLLLSRSCLSSCAGLGGRLGGGGGGGISDLGLLGAGNLWGVMLVYSLTCAKYQLGHRVVFQDIARLNSLWG